MESTVLVAIIGVGGIAVSTAGVVVVAFINNRREKTTTAESAIEGTLRERLVLRDEQARANLDEIERLKVKLREALDELDECYETRDIKDQRIEYLESQLKVEGGKA